MAASQKDHLKKIMKILGPEYPDHKPLLNFENPFQLLIATVLSAQCTDAAVNTVTPELFRRFPNPAAMADAPLAELERIIHPTGTFRVKAHNIKTISCMIIERFGGEVPDSMEALTSMPGVGRKTGSVVLSVIFGKPAIIVDTHFSRVTRRLGLTASDKPEKIEEHIAGICPPDEWTAVSNVLNRFGRAVCHARKPECDACRVKQLCNGP